MKKSYITALTVFASIFITSNANALINQNNFINPVTNVTEYKKVCEVCPYADQSMCANWQSNCVDTPIRVIDPVVTPVTPVTPDKPIIIDPDLTIRDFITTSTVSSCPSGTTKSSDGCCCINN